MVDNLETARLRLEPISGQHAEPMFAILTDARGYTFIPQEPPENIDALRARYQRLATRRSPDGKEIWLNWAIAIKEINNFIGFIQATIHQDQTAHLAYQLAPQFWRQGYAREACIKVIATLFQDYQVKNILADVDTRNQASCRLLERLGFTKREFRANADFFKGTSSDEYTYQLVSNQLVS